MNPNVKVCDSVNGKHVIFLGKCIECGCRQRIQVTQDEANAYNNGARIQDAFPNMPAGDREWLISGICGTCFDEMFDEEDYHPSERDIVGPL